MNLSGTALFFLIAGLACAGSPFDGKWDVTLKSGRGEYPSWIEFSSHGAALSAQMVGRWGSARPLPNVTAHGHQVEFLSPKREEGSKEDLHFLGTLSGGRIQGTVNAPDGTRWTRVAVRAPVLKRKGRPKWGEPIRLFDGNTTSGWRIRDLAGPSGWKVEDGLLTNHPRSTVVTDRSFTDFRLHVEFNCPPGCNSGVYLRGRYEVRIEDDSRMAPPTDHTGGVYGFIAPSPEMPRRPGEWQSFDVTLVGRTVSVMQNRTVIIDTREIPGITGGAVDSHEELPGPIMLQGDHGSLSFRNIAITPAQ